MRRNIQVLLDNAELTAPVREALERAGADVDVAELGATDGEAPRVPFDARLVLSNGIWAGGDEKLAQLNALVERDPCATLVISANSPASTVLGSGATQAFPVDFAGAMTAGELAGRLSAMCGLRTTMESLRERLADARQHGEALEQRVGTLSDDLRLAGDLQRELLPSVATELQGAEVEIFYRPANSVSGDLYYVARVDREHTAISIADATGHGVGAAFLSAFVERTLARTSSRSGRDAIPEPQEVLELLNDEIVGRNLRECHFVAALFAVYNERTRVLRWARGGAPYPILVRPGARPRQLKTEGPIVGVSAGARFDVVEARLEPGDGVIFHTDGLESLLRESGVGCPPRSIEQTSWFEALGRRPLSQEMRALNTASAPDSESDPHVDDATVVALRTWRIPENGFANTPIRESHAAAV